MSEAQALEHRRAGFVVLVRDAGCSLGQLDGWLELQLRFDSKGSFATVLMRGFGQILCISGPGGRRSAANPGQPAPVASQAFSSRQPVHHRDVVPRVWWSSHLSWRKVWFLVLQDQREVWGTVSAEGMRVYL